jgi:hypothetical protein
MQEQQEQMDPRLKDVKFDQVIQGLAEMLRNRGIVSRINYVNDHDKPTVTVGWLKEMSGNMCIFQSPNGVTTPVDARRITWVTKQMDLCKTP